MPCILDKGSLFHITWKRTIVINAHTEEGLKEALTSLVIIRAFRLNYAEKY